MATRTGKNAPFALTQYSPEQLKEALRKMHLIRKFEEGAEDSYTRGLIHGTMHLSIGQECSAVGSCMPLAAEDQITSTCLLYTSPSPRDISGSRMPSSA